jgi:alginate O-acetyltransferase complex protein AlgI
MVLLIASFVFYAAAAAPYLLLVLLTVILATFLCALGLSRARGEPARRLFFGLGVGVNILVLGSLKYVPFVADTLGSIVGREASAEIVAAKFVFVAVGVSFYVLTALSYLIDVYTGAIDAERHIGYLALHVAFFPKLTQGPIERAENVLPQLRQGDLPTYDRLRSGLLLIGVGLFKKVVLADRLGAYVDPVYDNVAGYSGAIFVIATYLYALQLYFDFSGYTDMARGSARLFNIDLMENFQRPYLSRSVAEFWRRWHISLSRWLLDYIFKPLQISWRRLKTLGTAAALLVTFGISGTWHGAAWHFVLWGALHGFYLASGVYYRPVQKALHARLGIRESLWLVWWQRAVTFHLVCFAWLFFRANSLSDALYIIGSIPSGFQGSRWIFLSRGYTELVVLVGALVVTGSLRSLLAQKDAYAFILSRPTWIRWSAYYGLLLSIVLLGAYGHSRFLYAQF